MTPPSPQPPTDVHTDRIAVDGATLYCERRGSGPALLMISGGGGDAGYYAEVAGCLADRWTVLTYDRRGNSRSPVADPAARMSMAQQSQDAVAVLRHHGFASGMVFGGSGGAVIGLDLATRNPEVVEAAILHEPPLIDVLPDPGPHRARFEEIQRVIRQEGPWSGYARFIVTIDRPDTLRLVRRRSGRRLLGLALRTAATLGRVGPGPVRDISRVLRNSPYLMTCELDTFIDFMPDLDALAATGVPVVLAGGADSRDYYPALPGPVLAQRLGAPFVEFPGGHAGYTEHGAAFAAVLRRTLEGLIAGPDPAARVPPLQPEAG